ncbi:MAG: Dps family protein [Acidimicrobiales bacterium]
MSKVDTATVVPDLQATLVELTHLALQGKQAHWNVVGTLFRPLHLQLDEVVNDLRGWVDLVAERIAALGDAPDGRLATLSSSSSVDEFPGGFIDGSKIVAEVVGRLEQVIAAIRDRIDRLSDSDLVTQDLLIEVAAGLEKHAWMFAAQQR